MKASVPDEVEIQLELLRKKIESCKELSKPLIEERKNIEQQIVLLEKDLKVDNKQQEGHSVRFYIGENGFANDLSIPKLSANCQGYRELSG
uniref:Uncharacterized protein n=1 Tax=Panagrolaimus sp. JU765 TaxID=591449 RepID=A0AC34PVD1_9BILA